MYSSLGRIVQPPLTRFNVSIPCKHGSNFLKISTVESRIFGSFLKTISETLNKN